MKPDAIQRAKRVDEMARCSRVMAETLDQFAREETKAQSQLGLARSQLVQAARSLEVAHDLLNGPSATSHLPSPEPLSDTNDPIHRRD